MKKALLYINLGTPDNPSVSAVTKYLKEFLMDPYVIDVPFLLRALLVHGLIVPRRAKKSAAAYRQIWSSAGSPLMVNSIELVSRLKEKFGKEIDVQLAMRYGSPSIQEAMTNLFAAGAEDVYVLPAYPQYALSSTETARVEVRRAYAKLSEIHNKKMRLHFIESYEAHPAFIEAYVENIVSAAQKFNPDFYLFSYHGLPIRHLQKMNQECAGEGECSLHDTPLNSRCYRRQCYKTTTALVKKLGLKADQFAVSFQSRLTHRWIKPFSDEFYKTLPQRGVQRLLVVCPSFVADCLETLEEVGLRARQDFRKSGGEDLSVVPCLNAQPSWVNGVHKIFNDSQLWGPL